MLRDAKVGVVVSLAAQSGGKGVEDLVERGGRAFCGNVLFPLSFSLVRCSSFLNFFNFFSFRGAGERESGIWSCHKLRKTGSRVGMRQDK